MTQFQHCIAVEGPAIGTGGHRMGFAPPTCLTMPRVKEFISTILL